MFELDAKLKRKLRKEIIDALISFIYENNLIEEIPNYSPDTNYTSLYQYPFESLSAKMHEMQISWFNVVNNVILPYYIKYIKWNNVYSFLRGRNKRDKLNRYLQFWVEFIRDVTQMKCRDISHRLCSGYAKRYSI